MKKLTKEQMEIVKSEHPEWFSDLKAGEWYRYNGAILCYQGLKNDIIQAYGLLSDGTWMDANNCGCIPDDWEEATHEEVKSALIAEAKRRYEVGDNIECLDGNAINLVGHGFIFFNGWVYASGYHDASSEYDVYDALFREGEWASVIPQDSPTLQDDIQALKDRWPDINFTVIAEGKK